jgi:hypothetical protein
MRKSKEFLIPDSKIPKLFQLATGRKYSTKQICINDLRRFFEYCLIYVTQEYQKIKKD